DLPPGRLWRRGRFAGRGETLNAAGRQTMEEECNLERVARRVGRGGNSRWVEDEIPAEGIVDPSGRHVDRKAVDRLDIGGCRTRGALRSGCGRIRPNEPSRILSLWNHNHRQQSAD